MSGLQRGRAASDKRLYVNLGAIAGDPECHTAVQTVARRNRSLYVDKGAYQKSRRVAETRNTANHAMISTMAGR